MRTKLVCLVVLLAVIGGCSNTPNHDEVIDGLVDAEHAFARDVAELGMREGFLKHLAEGSIAFSPTPTDAIAWQGGMADNPALLVWEPTMADASTAGDLGFTTGPWEMRPDGPDGEATSFGHYASVWIRNEGVWKLALDCGVLHAPVEVSEARLSRRGHVRTDAPLESPVAFEDVLDAERDLWLAAASDGFARALADAAAPDVMVCRMGEMPARGPGQAHELLWDEVNVVWEPGGGSVAESGDLGYTYGVMFYRDEDGSTLVGRSAYLRVWERVPSGAWHVVVDITNPIAEPDVPQGEPGTGGDL
ncbi:MAG: hypothetical protein ABIG03_06135 [Candidatus Eisenbacteria bacterium]